MKGYEVVSFPTLDGLQLRGWLYAARDRGPAVIATPGYGFVKEMSLLKVAASFQAAGITALIYDPRTLGESEGLPRGDLDPEKHALDYADAVTFLRSHPKVDPDRIALWGFSFNGMVALTAAATDKRSCCVVAVNPLTTMTYSGPGYRQLIQDAAKDAETRLAGGNITYVPILDESGAVPYTTSPGTTKDDYRLIARGLSMFPSFSNRTTVQTHLRISRWRPFELMSLIAPTPVLIVSGEGDQMAPLDTQKDLFKRLDGPKSMRVVEGKGHMDILGGGGFATIMQDQIDFIKRHRSIPTSSSKL